MTTPTSPPTPGRRERKKSETRARIRRRALELFERDGYAATTVERISDAADVSTTTFFRYFLTKDDTVSSNEFTPLFLSAFERHRDGLDPLAMVSAALRTAAQNLGEDAWAYERRRQNLVLREPAFRGPTFEQLRSLATTFGRLVSAQTGSPADSLEVRTFVGAVLGVFGAVVIDDELTVDDYTLTLDRALRHLRDGLPLRAAAPQCGTEGFVPS